jgi:hypothetical protein
MFTHKFPRDPQGCIKACQEVTYPGFNLLQKDVIQNRCINRLRHSGTITEQPLQTILRLEE